jgi:tetraacyldisaccharide 4'-kinase
MLYGGAVSVRNFGYDAKVFRARRLPIPVVSVGNITVGGSGKTPFVMFLIERLLSFGKRPAVLSRGYKRMTDDLVISCPGKGSEPDVQMIGDEPALISQAFPNVPVAVHKDRYRAGLAVLESHGCDAFLLDDGLQNRELYRDVDFVLIRNSISDLRDTYLPAGNLRDSKRRVSQADVVVLTSHAAFEFREADIDLIRKYSTAGIAGLSFLPSHLVDSAGSIRPLEKIAGKDVAAFCAVANPGQFFDELEKLGARIVSKTSYRDHHWFDEYDLDELFGGSEELLAVTTPKDAVRLFLDEELSGREEIKRIMALHEKAVVNFGLEHIDSALTGIFGEVHA